MTTSTAPRATAVDACRACGSTSLLPFLDLGSTPVANALLHAPDDPAPTFPLEVGVCRSCSLVQLLHVLPADALFGADYPYFSSVSEALDRHSRDHVEALRAAGRLTGDGLVVEVASNDGYLLRHVREHDVRVLGVEPSPGPAAAAEAAGIPTLRAFFGPQTAAEVRAEHGPADVVLANNVMAHVPDLQGFAAGLASLVADDGVVQVENPGVRFLLEHVEFDTVYHEHYCYFSTTAVLQLMASVGLHLNDVEVFPDLQGGTVRWTCSRRPGRTARADRDLALEQAAGLATPDPYLAFGGRVAHVQDRLRTLLADLRAGGSTLAAYGAAAKGATLLNSTGLDHTVLDYVVDRSPHKQGLWVPGARLEVLDPSALLERRPDHVLVLAWNYLDEVRRQQAEYECGGGRFVVPVPEPRVLDGAP